MVNFTIDGVELIIISSSFWYIFHPPIIWLQCFVIEEGKPYKWKIGGTRLYIHILKLYIRMESFQQQIDVITGYERESWTSICIYIINEMKINLEISNT